MSLITKMACDLHPNREVEAVARVSLRFAPAPAWVEPYDPGERARSTVVDVCQAHLDQLWPEPVTDETSAESDGKQEPAPESNGEVKLLRTQEVASMLGISGSTVRQWTRQGILTAAVRQSGAVGNLYTRSDVEKIASQ